MSGQDAASRIVVGVDGSPASLRALQWALQLAENTGAVVDAVIAWDIPPTYGFGPTVLEGEDLADAAQKSLAAAVEKVSAAHPNIAIQQMVVRGHPAAVLLGEAKDADLLVVGSRGYGGFVGALLGSVSQHCLHHATGPVVVVRSHD